VSEILRTASDGELVGGFLQAATERQTVSNPPPYNPYAEQRKPNRKSRSRGEHGDAGHTSHEAHERPVGRHGRRSRNRTAAFRKEAFAFERMRLGILRSHIKWMKKQARKRGYDLDSIDLWEL
jgi:hypothetical protein